jgi:hypothetical protein
MKLLSLTLLLLSLNVFSQITHYKSGWLDQSGMYPVLHVKGTQKQMGEQYGYLAAKMIKYNIDQLYKVVLEEEPALKKWVKPWLFKRLSRAIGFAFWVKYTKTDRDYIKGMKRGARKRGIRLNKYDISFLNTLIDLTGIIRAKWGDLSGGKRHTIKLIDRLTQMCNSFAAWGSRTVDNKTFQTRNTDITAGIGLEDRPLVVIAKPKGGIPYLASGMAGLAGMFTGMNAFGVSLGQVWAFSMDVKLERPWQFIIRDYFTKYRSAREVVEALKRRKVVAYGNNFVFADGFTSEGFSVEMSAKNFATFEDNDPRELNVKVDGEPVALLLEEAVLRGDLALDPTLRSRQLASNGPDGDPRTTRAYIERYLGQYSRIKDYADNNVKIGMQETIGISRDTASRGGSLQAAAYGNTDRDFWVSYSKRYEDGRVEQAFERPNFNVPFHRYLISTTVKK